MMVNIYTVEVVIHLTIGIFGVPLCDAIKTGSPLWGSYVPDPVHLCFLEIYKRGIIISHMNFD